MSFTPEKEEATRCGFASIVGRPNVGKSTLLNRIVGQKVAIVSRTPQTTRHAIRGIYTEERGQIVFLDTPGMHRQKDELDKFMNSSSVQAIEGADCLVHVVDVTRVVGPEENMVVEKVCRSRLPIILALNKVDQGDAHMDRYIMRWQEVLGEAFHDARRFLMLPVSAKTGLHCDKLVDCLFERLPPGPMLYPVETKTDRPQRLAIADIIREKLFEALRQEIPHSLAVHIESLVPKRRQVLFIQAAILVERASQKEIVIGRHGQMLKKAGQAARQELELLLDKKIFLDLHVKSKKNWRDSLSLLQELGYSL